MTTVVVPGSPGTLTAQEPRPGLLAPHPGVLLVALAVAAVRLPFVARPLSPDEGGFLLVASQWTSGRSLYGQYWVDRPPLLIGFFRLADELGGAVPLRLLGTALAAATVLLAAHVGRLVGGRSAAHGDRTTAVELLAAAAAAIFLTTPRFDAAEVNGELVAVPIVLLGLALLLDAAATTVPARRHWLLFSAGGIGAAAALVKQNEVDVLVALGVATVTLLPHARVSVVARNLAAGTAGALSTGVLVVTWAAWRGTGPPALWDALVAFRFEAGAVISASATDATTARFHSLLLAGAVTGAVLLPLQLVLGFRSVGRGPLADLRWPAVAVLGWELLSVLAGGSYWLHYLVALVPGLVLTVCLLARGSRRRATWLRCALAYAAVVAVVGLGRAVTGQDAVSPVQSLEAWLIEHRSAGDTAVVAFGHPDVLEATGMSSPYPELWSLPVRVRDPRLLDLARVLRGADRPAWVIALNGSTTNSLASWGIDPRTGQAQLDAHYRPVAEIGGDVVLLERSRSLGSP